MAGPVDTRVSPTEVNELAHSKPLSWFEQNVISHRAASATRVRRRRVYPGFLQVSAFVTMNVGRHVSQHVKLYHQLMRGDYAEAAAIEDFYDEYFAVLDMPAEFYLQTVDAVFQRELLAQGLLTWRGQPVEPAAIRRTALLTVEGEKDDVCGVGQTMAAQELCTGIKPSKKRHHLQPGRGPLRRIQRDQMGEPDLPHRAQLHPGQRLSRSGSTVGRHSDDGSPAGQNSISSSSTSSGSARASAIHSTISGMARMVST